MSTPQQLKTVSGAPSVGQGTGPVDIYITFCASMRALAASGTSGPQGDDGMKHAVRTLVSFLDLPFELVVGEAAAAIADLVESSEPHRATVAESGGVDALLQLVTPNCGYRIFAAKALCCLAASSSSDLLARADLVEPFIKLTVEGSDRVKSSGPEQDGALWGARMLQLMASTNDALSRRVFDSSLALGALFVLLLCDHDEFAQESAGALRALFATSLYGADESARGPQTRQLAAALRSLPPNLQSRTPPADMADEIRQVALELVNAAAGGTDQATLDDAIEFGRWVGVDQLVFGKARSRFTESLKAREAKRQAAERKKELSVKRGDAQKAKIRKDEGSKRRLQAKKKPHLPAYLASVDSDKDEEAAQTNGDSGSGEATAASASDTPAKDAPAAGISGWAFLRRLSTIGSAANAFAAAGGAAADKERQEGGGMENGEKSGMAWPAMLTHDFSSTALNWIRGIGEALTPEAVRRGSQRRASLPPRPSPDQQGGGVRRATPGIRRRSDSIVPSHHPAWDA